MWSRVSLLRFIPLLAALASGCAPEAKFPGSEVMGTFEFGATASQRGCELSDFSSDPFTFQGTFSRNPDSTDVFFTLNEVTRTGTFDGQNVDAVFVAPRRFDSCACPGKTSLAERLTVSLLSNSQNARVGNRCPENPLDGGVPLDEDAGVRGPGSTASGFDAVRACGTLTDTLLKDSSCGCGACEVQFVLTGVRR